MRERKRDDDDNLDAIWWRDERWTRRPDTDHRVGRCEQDRHILIGLLRETRDALEPGRHDDLIAKLRGLR